MKPDIDFICVHDAARPCLADAWISKVFEAAEKHDAAILAIPVAGTLKRVGKNTMIEETVPRAGLWEAQTPQVFRRQLLLEAYAKRGGHPATDDAELVERVGHAVAIVPRLADQFENHHERRFPPGRAGDESHAQAETSGPRPSLRRRRHVAVREVRSPESVVLRTMSRAETRQRSKGGCFMRNRRAAPVVLILG